MDDLVKEENIFDIFVNKLHLIYVMHSEGRLYCETSDIWNEHRYHKNLVYYSPRIRALLNKNLKFEITFYDDIYYLFIETYVEITGYVPPPYFRLNKTWLKIIKRKMSDYNEKKADAFISLFSKCTSNIAEYMINDIPDVMRLGEFEILK